MKPVIVGMNSSKSSDPAQALEPYTRNGAGERLWMMVHNVTGWDKEEYCKRFELMNLLDQKEWSARDAAIRAGLMRFTLNRRRSFVLGRDVWNALKLPDVKWLGRVDHFTLIPHPSGKNLVYNESKMVKRVGEMLAQAGGWSAS